MNPYTRVYYFGINSISFYIHINTPINEKGCETKCVNFGLSFMLIPTAQIVSTFSVLEMDLFVLLFT